MPGRASAYQHKGDDVHVKAGGALDNRERADPAKLVGDDGPAHEHVITHFDMTADSDIIGEYRVIADFAIMSDMAVVHEIAARADARFGLFLRGPVRGKTFPENIVVAADQPRHGVGFKTGILGQTAQHGMGMQDIAVAHFHVALDDGMRADLTVGADFNAGFDDRERPYRDVVSE